MGFDGFASHGIAGAESCHSLVVARILTKFVSPSDISRRHKLSHLPSQTRWPVN